MTPNNRTILITGIGGFIGLRAAEMALERGFTVRGFQRTYEKAKPAEKLGVEVIIGDITDPVAAAEACKDVDVVLHAAAIVKQSGDLKEFQAVNVTGTITMANAARNAGAKTFVHLSSVMVYGMKYPDGVAEDGPLYDGDNPYCKTKIESEQQILPLNQPPEFGVIVIRPGDVYGPGNCSWTLRPIQMMRDGKFVLVNGGKGVMNHVYVDNLIDGIFLAIERQAYGEIFNLTDGCKTSWKDYYKCLAAIAGINAPMISMPAFLAKAAAKLLTDIPPELIDIGSRPYAYSIQKARHHLGYHPQITLDEGIKRTAEWLRRNAWA